MTALEHIEAALWHHVAQLLIEADPETHPLYLAEFAEWYDGLPVEQRAKVWHRFMFRHLVDFDTALLFKVSKNQIRLGEKVWEAKIGKHGEALRVYYQRAPHQHPRARLLFGSNSKSGGDQQRSIDRAKELAKRPFEA